MEQNCSWSYCMVKVKTLDETKELTKQWLESRWNDKQEKIVVYVTQEYYDMLKEKYKIEE